MQMDLVASPTDMSASPDQQIDENLVRRANLAPSDSVAVDVNDDRPQALNKPPLLKHVYATPALLPISMTELVP